MLLIVAAVMVSGQSAWRDLGEQTVEEGRRTPRLSGPVRVLSLENDDLFNDLLTAPVERSGLPGLLVEMPAVDGRMSAYRLWRSEVLHPDLAARYPELATYRGVGANQERIALSVGPGGLNAMILMPDHSVHIEPQDLEESLYRVYSSERIAASDDAGFCGLPGDDSPLRSGAADVIVPGDCQERTFRLAASCTGEYAQYHGGTVLGALDAITTVVSQLNEVYLKELGIRFQLIANTDQLLYTDAATDPFVLGGTFADASLTENQANTDAVIGTGGYDIGHLFATAGILADSTEVAGLATRQSLCNSALKARGRTGVSDPINARVLRTMLNEVGHQLGANHTQSNPCNRNNQTAMETGSGSSIMSYGGVCPPNVVISRSSYLHAVSIFEIRQHVVIGDAATCGLITPTTHGNPVADAGPDRIMPRATPFVLKPVTASDPLGDSVWVSWEQIDPQLAPSPPSASFKRGPLFRSFPPSTRSERAIPAEDLVISDLNSPWEVLPTVSRLASFRMTVRDNKGCTAESDMRLQFASGPFYVTRPNTALQFNADSLIEVRWKTGNTENPPINESSVNIRLSVDGGKTYPHPLALGTANDGAHFVQLPRVQSKAARVKVESADGRFYDISDRSFEITALGGKTQVADGDTITLTVEDDSLAFVVSLQWQRSDDGSIWIDLPGEILGSVTFVADDSLGAVQYYRCMAMIGSCEYPSVVNILELSSSDCGAPLVDIDGNSYNTVQIGEQCWMAENLKVEKYRDGSNIHTGLSNSAWGSSSSGAYAVYNNLAANKAIYGLLYNWYAVDDSRGLCPTGWHVPTDGEWTELTNHLGGELVAGGQMKTTGTLSDGTGLWTAPNVAATNSSGFSGLPGGGRLGIGGVFLTQGNTGYWWSSSEDSAFPVAAWFRQLSCCIGNASRLNTGKQDGFSVRCLKD